MTHYPNTPPERDPRIWQLAQRRVAFKYHLIIYLIVNAFFWILWAMSNRQSDAMQEAIPDNDSNWPWPVWPTIGWGVGLLFHFLGAYVFPRESSVEREYQRLKKQNPDV